MIYVKMVSLTDARTTFLTECNSLRRWKKAVASKEELHDLLQELKSYRTPLPVPALEGEWDWKASGSAEFMMLSLERYHQALSGESAYETYLLWGSMVYCMNEAGDTIDRLKV